MPHLTVAKDSPENVDFVQKHERQKILGLAKWSENFSFFPFSHRRVFLHSQEFCGWQDEPFEEMDSTLVVQQYIQQLIRKEPSNVELILSMPDGQDEGVWKYEHLR